LFTNDEGILNKIENNDWLNKGLLYEVKTEVQQNSQNNYSKAKRPMTASRVIDENECLLSDKPRT
jgi:hypothetical protein